MYTKVFDKPVDSIDRCLLFPRLPRHDESPPPPLQPIPLPLPRLLIPQNTSLNNRHSHPIPIRNPPRRRLPLFPRANAVLCVRP